MNFGVDIIVPYQDEFLGFTPFQIEYLRYNGFVETIRRKIENTRRKMQSQHLKGLNKALK